MKIRFEGTDEIARKLKAMGAALRRDTLLPIMMENLEPMAADMRAHAARRSGRMAESVTVSTELSPAQAASNIPIAPIEVFVGPGPLPEAIQEEFGNFHQAAAPFIRPGFDGNVKLAMRAIAEEGIDAILTAAKKG